MYNYQQETDERLVSLYEQGNDQAFDELLARYQSKVYSYILFIVHDEERANDLLQDTFIKVIVRIRSHKYVESGKFGSWLLRIAHNLVIDSFRVDQAAPMVRGDEEGCKVFNDPALSDNSYEAQHAMEQVYVELEHMLDRLPGSQQEVGRLRFYQNKSFKEIAELTNCSINTALGRMRYAVLNLRKMAVHHDLTV